MNGKLRATFINNSKKSAFGSYEVVFGRKWRIDMYTYMQYSPHTLILMLILVPQHYRFANMMSSVYIVDDQCCERIRTALELTDVDKDIHTFVKKYGTGKVLPGK